MFRPGIGEMPSTILGKPFVVHNGLPNTFIGFGALRYYYLFDHGDMGMESTTTGGDTFKKPPSRYQVLQRLTAYSEPRSQTVRSLQDSVGVTALGTYRKTS